MDRYVINHEYIEDKFYYGLYREESWSERKPYIQIDRTRSRPNIRANRENLVRTDGYHLITISILDLAESSITQKIQNTSRTLKTIIVDADELLTYLKPELLTYMKDPILAGELACRSAYTAADCKMVFSYDLSKSKAENTYDLVFLDRADFKHMPPTKADEEFMQSVNNKKNETTIFNTMLKPNIDNILSKYGMMIADYTDNKGVIFKDDDALLAFMRKALEMSVLKDLREELGIEAKVNKRIKVARYYHSWFDLVTGDWIKKHANKVD